MTILLKKHKHSKTFKKKHGKVSDYIGLTKSQYQEAHFVIYGCQNAQIRANNNRWVVRSVSQTYENLFLLTVSRLVEAIDSFRTGRNSFQLRFYQNKLRLGFYLIFFVLFVESPYGVRKRWKDEIWLPFRKMKRWNSGTFRKMKRWNLVTFQKDEKMKR